MVLATIVNLAFVPVLYVVIVGLRERLSGRRAPVIETAGAPTIERSPSGGLVVSFANGSDPVRLNAEVASTFRRRLEQRVDCGQALDARCVRRRMACACGTLVSGTECEQTSLRPSPGNE